MTESLPIYLALGDASPSWVAPDACTLPTVEQPMRVAEFDSLFAEALASTEYVSATSVRFVLSGGENGAARAQDLADRETGCCSFFTFAITSTGPDSAVMDVTVPDERADVLAALVNRAQAASMGTAGVTA